MKIYELVDDSSGRGDGVRTYEFVLKGGGGRYDQSARIVLPSVTGVISAVLARPQLMQWVYDATIDALGGGVSAAAERYNETDEADEGLSSGAFRDDLLDTFSDHELLDEWVRESGLHYERLADEAAERGKKAHAALAGLATCYAEHGQERALEEAARLTRSRNPFEQAVGTWWAECLPRPLLSEQVVVSLRHGYAGRLDLVADLKRPGTSDWAYETALIDLKTRRADLGAYRSDEVQLGAYRIALEEMDDVQVSGQLIKTVLLARDDGTYLEHRCWVPDEAFLHLLEAYKLMRRTRIA